MYYIKNNKDITFKEESDFVGTKINNKLNEYNDYSEVIDVNYEIVESKVKTRTK